MIKRPTVSGLIRHYFSRQFARFIGVGVTAALANWLVRIALSNWLPFAAAVLVAYAFGMGVAFCLNRLFVFPNSTRPLPEQVRSFTLINLGAFPVVWGASLVLDAFVLPAVGIERWRQEIAHGIALVVPTLVTFLLYKFSTFRKH